MGRDFVLVKAYVTTENTLSVQTSRSGQNLIAAKDQSRQKPGARAPSPAECTTEGIAHGICGMTQKTEYPHQARQGSKVLSRQV